MKIPFNQPHITGKELHYLAEVNASGKLSGDGFFTKRCQAWLEQKTGSKSLLTHSCTAALEMAALLLDIQPGDEVIMPSYTFVSTANAFVLRGAVPVFIDIREDTLNLNELLLEEAITDRTRVIIPVHYAGVACEMDSIMAIAEKHGLKVVEDAAQGVMATYKNRPLGSIGHLGAYSFHDTKNIISGEGGALLISTPDLISRAETIREKGTDRNQFLRGEVDKYTWQELGSSFLPSELIAAFLWAQFEAVEGITQERLAIWECYHQKLEMLERLGILRRPIIPNDCQHNAHMYYVLLSPEINSQQILKFLKQNDIGAVSHYVPLHNSPAGKKYGRAHGDLPVTIRLSESLIRLPLWIGLNEVQQERVIAILTMALENK